MMEASNSETDRRVVTAGQVRILRLCRLPLVAALLIVGAHTGIAAFERLERSAASTAREPGTVDRPPLVADAGPGAAAADKIAGDESPAEQEDALLQPEEIVCVPDAIFVESDEAADSGWENFPCLASDSMEDGQTPADAEPTVEDSQWPVDEELTGTGDAADEVADSARPSLEEETSTGSDEAVEPDETPEVSTDEPADVAEVEEADEETAEPVAQPPSVKTVLLKNDTPGVVRYLVNGEAQSLGPGETQKLASESSWRIQFHRGGNFGNAEHTVSEGVHAFRVTESGWDLQAASIADLP